MLRFFRTIRKKLIEQDNARKYLLYAVGEILLVVIGILIALQVNNWNAARQTAKADAVFLARLEEDLAAMRASIADEAAFASKLEAGAYYALRALEACEIDPDRAEAIDLALSAYQTAPAALVFSGAYEEMTASGAFARIENAALKDAIAAIYAGLDRFNAIVGYIRRDHSAAGRLLWERVDFSYESLGGLHTANVNLLDYCDDRLMRNAIWELADTHGDWKRFAQALVDDIDRALAELKGE